MKKATLVKIGAGILIFGYGLLIGSLCFSTARDPQYSQYGFGFMMVCIVAMHLIVISMVGLLKGLVSLVFWLYEKARD